MITTLKNALETYAKENDKRIIYYAIGCDVAESSSIFDDIAHAMHIAGDDRLTNASDLQGLLEDDMVEVCRCLGYECVTDWDLGFRGDLELIAVLA